MLVDTREPTEIAQRLSELGHTVEIKELAVGDYVEGQVGIERKAGDFLNFNDVESKVADLVFNFKFPYLIVELDLPQLEYQAKYRGILPKQLYGFIDSLAVRGIVPLFCSSQERLVQVISGLVKKTYDGKQRIFTPDPIRPDPKPRDYKLGILKGYPDVSWTRAEALLKNLGSVQKVTNATEKELMEVPGIGKTLAKRIYDTSR